MYSQMPSSMEELVHHLNSSSGGGFASDPRAHRLWRALRWKAKVDGFDLRSRERMAARFAEAQVRPRGRAPPQEHESRTRRAALMRWTQG